jgi:hypothetical protein
MARGLITFGGAVALAALTCLMQLAVPRALIWLLDRAPGWALG